MKILHSDGTYAVYAHFEEDGIIVSMGEYLEEGQLIGYSGNTGYSSGPHLHFSILENDNFKKASIPFKFRKSTSNAGYRPVQNVMLEY